MPSSSLRTLLRESALRVKSHPGIHVASELVRAGDRPRCVSKRDERSGSMSEAIPRQSRTPYSVFPNGCFRVAFTNEIEAGRLASGDDWNSRSGRLEKTR